MDTYTQHLWAMAWERFDRTLGGWFTVNKQGLSRYIVEYAVSPGLPVIRTAPAPTLADALLALLADLGVEAPERPSAEAVERAREWFRTLLGETGVMRFEHQRERDPLLIRLALLEGDAS